MTAGRPAGSGPVGVSAQSWGWRHASRRAWALRGLDLDVAPGERVMLLGPSGSGKSTLLAGLAGLLDPGTGPHDGSGDEEGRLLLDGVPAVQARRRAVGAHRARTGLLLQDPLAQTVLARCGDDVAFGLENYAVTPEQIWPRVDEALDAVRFPYGRAHPTSRLSGGQRQRLALAGVLALRPGLLLLDEPTAMLDDDGRALLHDQVARLLGDRAMTCVLVEHRVAPWLDLVDRVAVVQPGAGVIADGPPERVLGEQGARLAAQGVWVPGVTPRPVRDTRGAGGATALGAGGTAARGVGSTAVRGAGGTAALRVNGTAARGAGGTVAMGVGSTAAMGVGGTAVRGVGGTAATGAGGTAALGRGGVRVSPGTVLLTARGLAAGRSRPARGRRVAGRAHQGPAEEAAGAIVRGVDLTLRAGEATCVVGPNGVGKSTLALVLGGLRPPVAGELLASPWLADGAGPSPYRWSPRQLVIRIGTVFQEPQHQFVAATAEQELCVGPRRCGVSDQVARERAGELLQRLRLDKLARANPFTLSGGEQRRLSVATALATRPPVLVLDEPTFGQDARTWVEVVDLLLAEVADGRCVLAVTHDEALVDALAGPVLRLGDARAQSVVEPVG